MDTIQLMKRKIADKSKISTKMWRNIISNSLSDLQNEKIFVNFGDSSAVLSKSDCIRAVSETIPESAVRNLLLKCLLDAENQSVGSSFIMLSLLAGNEPEKGTVGKRFTMDQVRSSLKFLTDSLSSRISIESTIIAGRQGKVMLDSNISQQTEVSYGSQSCKWKPDESFFSTIGSSKVAVQNCKVLFIDGIIESVSEIHHLFHSSYEEKTPIVIFARGFAAEVIKTAAVNIQRQTAQIIPIVVPFDEIGINGMADIAGCFGSEVVSADKGQLISSIKLNECVSADRIISNLSSTEIEFKNNRIENVVEKLSIRLRSCDDNQADFIRRRIAALGTGTVTIKVGSDKKSLAGLQRDHIDFCLRYIKSCMSSGVIKFNGIYFPSTSMKSGISCANSFVSMLQNCGNILEVDNVVGS